MASGPVPRTIAPGIVWDEAAEAEYARQLLALSAEMAGEDAEREARWFVEAQLCRRFYRVQVERALRCATADAKRALFLDWQKRYGNERARRLARFVKNEKTSKVVMTW